MDRRLNIAFVHPNLGIGGAERLVVDTALGLQRRGHRVVLYTMHHDPAHCFEETRDGTLEVRVCRTRLVPSSVCGRLHILCTILQSLALARRVATDPAQYDVLFVDQLSAPIPLLKHAHAHILFYCHFPDYLQARRDGAWRRLYRAPFDLLEELTTAEADEIAVNSRFTQEAFRAAFPRIARLPRVLMPALNLAAYDRPPDLADPALAVLRTAKRLVVSINRFERKKDVALAIDAFAALGDPTACLVVAGGWDVHVPENIEHLVELEARARGLGLRTRTVAPRGSGAAALALLPAGAVRTPTLPDDGGSGSGSSERLAETDVLFLPSFSENQRAFLLSVARCTVYTPANEHLGIVPLESMYMRVPVVAADSGGPRETVPHGVAGYLCEPASRDAFGAAIRRVLAAPDDAWAAMGAAGRERVRRDFGLDAYTARLERIVAEMLARPQAGSPVLAAMAVALVALAAAAALALARWV
ncbi:Alpha-1,3-mannosyltransferase-like protein [Coemansia javaensis]|uniref:Alpha-1,3/1,6-mannosyltransferase ALG2 n=1 Tax=Coemansia javaensis TaxID=2761396 RepID=A0A9W8LI15_9FUNG|nr:Alpha-1,3-mannosyltransferase-like protein [Coemansia javaensis]